MKQGRLLGEGSQHGAVERDEGVSEEGLGHGPESSHGIFELQEPFEVFPIPSFYIQGPDSLRREVTCPG